MVVNELSRDLLEFRHDGVAGARLAIVILAAILGMGAALVAMSGNLWPLVVILLLGAFFYNLLRRSSALSVALFDRGARQVTITHSRNGKEIEREEIPLRAVARVIIEQGSGTKGHRVRRPALLVGTRIVPLTWRAFEAGDAAVEAALAIRRFLGQSEFRLMEDSKEAFERYSERSIRRAARIARYGHGPS